MLCVGRQKRQMSVKFELLWHAALGRFCCCSSLIAYGYVVVFDTPFFNMLGMHDTFVTRCCETRISQHFLLPVTYVDSVNAAKYFLPAKYKRVLPKKILIELAAAMANNDSWKNLMLPPPGGPGGGGGGLIAASGTRGGNGVQGPLERRHGLDQRWPAVARVAWQARAGAS